MDRRKLLTAVMGGKAAVIPWYLAGGIEASTIYGAWAAKGAANIAASYVNLASPGVHDLTTTDAPGFNTATGWIFSGSKFLTTGLIPDTTGIYSMFAGVNTLTSTFCGLFGYRINGGRGFGVIKSSATQLIFQNHGTATYATGDFTSAVVGQIGKLGYYNGSNVATTDQDNLEQTSTALYIGAISGADAIGGSSTVVCAILFNKSTVLTAGQITALSMAISSL